MRDIWVYHHAEYQFSKKIGHNGNADRTALPLGPMYSIGAIFVTKEGFMNDKTISLLMKACYRTYRVWYDLGMVFHEGVFIKSENVFQMLHLYPINSRNISLCYALFIIDVDK